MPRPRTNVEDFWAWEAEKNGVFSVKSAYRLLMDQKLAQLNEPSTSQYGEVSWKALWRLRVQPKIRVFWWRAMKKILPSSAELHRRHVGESGHCPMCGNSEETLFHALTKCDHAVLFWNEAKNFFNVKLPRLHPLTWKQDLLDSAFLKKDHAVVIISVMWVIWSNRNKYTHGEAQYQPLKSMELIHELITSLDIPRGEPAGQNVTKGRWKAPLQGWVKLNCDEATNQATGDAGSGVVARDDRGSFLFARCSKYPAKEDPSIAEILACRDAVKLAMDRSLSHVIVETDCQSIYTMWTQGDDRSVGGQVFREMRSYLSSFQGFDLVFVHREANSVAHQCARHSLSLHNSCTMDVIPEFLIESVQSEMFHLNE